MAAFLFSSGFFRRDRNSMGVSLLVGLLYGSLVYGFFPNDAGISWQGHLFGAIGGVVAAYYFKNVDLPSAPAWPDEEETTESEEHFFDKIQDKNVTQVNVPPTIVYHLKPRKEDAEMENDQG
jgi:hypothetical protein